MSPAALDHRTGAAGPAPARAMRSAPGSARPADARISARPRSGAVDPGATVDPGVPRVVLDTNVWLDLLWFRDPCCAPLAAALAEGRLLALSRPDCHAEWRRVLGYPALGIAAGTAEQLDAQYRRRTVLPVPLPATGPALPRCRDPDDQKFLELARDGAAVALLSRDLALLRLSRRLQRAGLFAVLPPSAFQPPSPVGTRLAG